MAKKRGRTSAGSRKKRAAKTRRRSASTARPIRAKRRPVARAAGRRRTARKAKAARKTAKPVRKTAKPVRAAQPIARGTRLKVPALDRQRRTLEDDDTVPTPPSSLNMDRRGSAARTGRAELREKLHEHTETSPALTGGDVDANWEEAYSSGDEAPGGDNPTPDASVVDDIGRSLGVEYDDAEELKGSAKIDKRDAKRWELDPASSEDYKDRTKK